MRGGSEKTWWESVCLHFGLGGLLIRCCGLIHRAVDSRYVENEKRLILGN